MIMIMLKRKPCDKDFYYKIREKYNEKLISERCPAPNAFYRFSNACKPSDRPLPLRKRLLWFLCYLFRTGQVLVGLYFLRGGAVFVASLSGTTIGSASMGSVLTGSGLVEDSVVCSFSTGKAVVFSLASFGVSTEAGVSSITSSFGVSKAGETFRVIAQITRGAAKAIFPACNIKF